MNNYWQTRGGRWICNNFWWNLLHLFQFQNWVPSYTDCTA